MPVTKSYSVAVAATLAQPRVPIGPCVLAFVPTLLAVSDPKFVRPTGSDVASAEIGLPVGKIANESGQYSQRGCGTVGKSMDTKRFDYRFTPELGR
jgi:hypothetical protein